MMKMQKMNGAYGIGKSIPNSDSISKTITILTDRSKKRNFLSLKGKFMRMMIVFEKTFKTH